MGRIGLLCVALGLAFSASADSLDPVMGLWEGDWSSDAGGGGRISAQVMALGGDKYQALFAAEIEGTERPLSMPLKATKDGDKIKLEGEFNLSEELGGKYKMTAVIAGEEWKGQSTSENIKAETSMKRVHKKSPTLGAKPPEGAVVLFDGTNLDHWLSRGNKPAGWKVEDGVMTVGGRRGDIHSKETFQDAKIHIEFRTPFLPLMRGQGRGNSGVYVQGLYEVQVLDSFGLPPKDNEAGGIYEIAVPKQNASLPPGEWQTYDITFHGPKFDADGKVTKPAEITVVHNGTVIHDKVVLPRPTKGNLGNDPKQPGPIMLQDHGNPVSFRNIWFVPLKD